ncbi:hypothetical protein, partial [Alistipes finegoldii]
MNRTLLLLLLFLVLRSTAQAQLPDTSRFLTAYTEIADMLDGKSSLSIKRAVFLAEWAYLDGNLDYDWFCSKIDSAVIFLHGFMKANGLDKYKTGKNMAIIEYFFNPWSGNGYKPFTYDHNDIDSKQDFTQQFVSKLIRTHKGQCRSLPYYYKILAEAIGAEAYIAYAPIHTFIRYPDADNLFPEDWVNVELTTHQYTPEFYYIESFEINAKALQNKVYLHPLTDRETVAAQLSDLAVAYTVKYGVYDDFTWLCSSKSFEYYPCHYNTLITMGKSLDIALGRYLDNNGNKVDQYVLSLEKKSKELYEQLLAMGWEQLGEEYFK